LICPEQAAAQLLYAVFADAGAEEVGRTGAEDFASCKLESFQYLADVGGARHLFFIV
jgi:hypothetical protein